MQGQIDLQEQRPNSTVEDWRAGLLQTGGNNADLTWRLAVLLLEMGRVHEAEPLIEQYRRLIGGEAMNPGYHYLHALSLLRTDRPEEALKELEAVQYKTDKALEPMLYLLLGQCYEAVHDTAKALDAYHRTTELAREMVEPWLAICASLEAEAALEEAIETLQLGLKALPGDPRLLAMEVELPGSAHTLADAAAGGPERLLDRGRAGGSMRAASVGRWPHQTRSMSPSSRRITWPAGGKPKHSTTCCARPRRRTRR